MRIIIFVLTIILFLYNTFLFGMLLFGVALSGCPTNDPCATELHTYLLLFTIILILCLVGLIGMGKSLSDYGSKKFSKFAIIGFLLPLIVFIFVRDFNQTKIKEHSSENVERKNKYYQEHCLNMLNNDGTRYWSCDNGTTFPIK